MDVVSTQVRSASRSARLARRCVTRRCACWDHAKTRLDRTSRASGTDQATSAGEQIGVTDTRLYSWTPSSVGRDNATNRQDPQMVVVGAAFTAGAARGAARALAQLPDVA